MQGEMSAPSTLTKPWLTQPQQSGRALLWCRIAKGSGVRRSRGVRVALLCPASSRPHPPQLVVEERCELVGPQVVPRRLVPKGVVQDSRCEGWGKCYGDL